MKITIEMPNVSGCQVTECGYNRDKACHARAITIGDGVHPGCDTYFSPGQHVQNTIQRAGVGACKVTGCRYNSDFECGADNIQVGFAGDAINCLTYTAA